MRCAGYGNTATGVGQFAALGTQQQPNESGASEAEESRLVLGRRRRISSARVVLASGSPGEKKTTAVRGQTRRALRVAAEVSAEADVRASACVGLSMCG